LLLIIISAFVNCAEYYSGSYNKEIEDLIDIEPQSSLHLSLKLLSESEQKHDVEGQLIAMFYVIESLDMLSRISDIDIYVEKGLKLAIENDNKRFQSEFLSYKATQLQLKGNYQEAHNEINQSISFANKTEDLRLIAIQLATKSDILTSMEKYTEAINNLNQALDIFKKYSDRKKLSLYYNLLGIIYAELHQHDNAIKYYQESINLDSMTSNYNLSTKYYNLGDVYIEKKEYEKAIQYLNLAKQLSFDVNDEYSLAYINYSLAHINMNLKNYDKAKNYLLEVYKVFEESKDFLMLFNSYLFQIEILIKQQDYNRATEVLNLAESHVKNLNTPNDWLAFYKKKRELLTIQSKWQAAYLATIEINKFQNEIHAKDKNLEISELTYAFNNKFDREKKELSFKQKQLEQDLSFENKKKNYFLLTIGVISIFLFVILFLLFRQILLNRKLTKISITADLTQLPNRRNLMNQLHQYHHKCKSKQKCYTIILLEIEGFRAINDEYGHKIGNELIKYFANVLKDKLINKEEFGRIGNNEWLILTKEIETGNLQIMIDNLKLEFLKNKTLLIPQECKLSFVHIVQICQSSNMSVDETLLNLEKQIFINKKSIN
jgi:diguanylate cyclase (GGDEF)-like protein